MGGKDISKRTVKWRANALNESTILAPYNWIKEENLHLGLRRKFQKKYQKKKNLMKQLINRLPIQWWVLEKCPPIIITPSRLTSQNMIIGAKPPGGMS